MKYVIILFVLVGCLFLVSCDSYTASQLQQSQMSMYDDMVKYKFETGSCMTVEQATAVSRIYNYKYINPSADDQVKFINIFTKTCNKGKE